MPVFTLTAALRVDNVLTKFVSAWYDRHVGERLPWTNVYGLARTTVASGTFLTLSLNPSQYLFRPGSGEPGIVGCDNLAGHFSFFCILPANNIWIAQVLAAAILFLVVIGWQPRLTAIPHWWISASFYNSVRDGDGGDQMAAVLTLLLLPLALTDPREWHWADCSIKRFPFIRVAVGFVALWLTQIQVALVYFDSFVEKLRVPEWADGTELYYVLHNNFFGAPSYLAAITEPLSTSILIVFVTWSVLVTEFFLGVNIFLPFWARRVVLIAGLCFHALIAIVLGITSFAIIMCGAIIVGLSPSGMQLGEVFNFWPRSVTNTRRTNTESDNEALGSI